MRATLDTPTRKATETTGASAVSAPEPVKREAPQRPILIKSLLSFACFILALWQGDYWIGQTLEHFYFDQKSGADWNTTVTLMHSTADIEIFGDSRGCHHYDPTVIENTLENKLTCHNSSRTAQTILYSDAVQSVLLDRHKPRVIVLDLNPGVTIGVPDAADRLSVLLPYYDDIEAIRPFVTTRSRHEKFKLLSRCYRYNSKLPTILKHSMSPEISSLKGHHPLIGQLPPHAFEIPASTPATNELPELIDHRQEQALVDFVKRANTAGVRVVLISSPIYKKSYERASEELALKAIDGLDFEWWDFLEDPRFYGQKEKFYDRTHLNAEAAQEFSRIIAQRLRPLLTRPTLAQVSMPSR